MPGNKDKLGQIMQCAGVPSSRGPLFLSLLLLHASAVSVQLRPSASPRPPCYGSWPNRKAPDPHAAMKGLHESGSLTRTYDGGTVANCSRDQQFLCHDSMVQVAQEHGRLMRLRGGKGKAAKQKVKGKKIKQPRKLSDIQKVSMSGRFPPLNQSEC